MVNYCCVVGCGRNSRDSKQLNFYTIPKDCHRTERWLVAAGRQDLLDKPQQPGLRPHRICTRHFAPECFKNKHLRNDAIPTLYLPGGDGPHEEPVTELRIHRNIYCNNCGNVVTGFRYKCMVCPDYDMCPRCEMMETHGQHFMLRIPTEAKFKVVKDTVQKWQVYCNEISKEKSDDSSDDEPITKYVKNYDSGVDLTEDVKESIRNEVARVLSLRNKEIIPDKAKTYLDKSRKTATAKNKICKIETVDLSALFPSTIKLVREDNQSEKAGSRQNMVKSECPIIFEEDLVSSLPEDLSELMMEVTDLT